MRTARTLLLALLVLLLPMRGAVAGAVVCTDHARQGAVAVTVVAHGDAADQHQQQLHAAHAGCSDDAPGDDDGSVACKTCAASCSTSPLMAAAPCAASPPRLGQARLSSQDARATHHPCDGPERPPRVI